MVASCASGYLRSSIPRDLWTTAPHLADICGHLLWIISSENTVT